MKALSVRQPWAFLIVNQTSYSVYDLAQPYPDKGLTTRLGRKDVENRSKKTNYRGEILIHAAGTKAKDHEVFVHRKESEKAWETRLLAGAPKNQRLPYGGIVGVAEIVDCQDCDVDSPWWDGEGWAWRLANQTSLPFSPLRGALGLFNVEEKNLHPDTLEALEDWRLCVRGRRAKVNYRESLYRANLQLPAEIPFESEESKMINLFLHAEEMSAAAMASLARFFSCPADKVQIMEKIKEYKQNNP